MSQPLPAPPAPATKNTLGLVALIIAAVGFIFACIPGALIIGWILLPIAFILSIVALFMKGKKWQAVTGLILSIVGSIVGAIVFTVAVATAVTDAFGDTETGVISESEQPAAEADTDAPDAAEEGSRANPFPLGTTFGTDEWTVTVNSVTLDATQAVMNENSFNSEPDAGYQYALVNMDVTYTGDDPEGGMPVFVTVEYVTADGRTIEQLSKLASGPGELDRLSTLYNGATASGNIVLHIPTDGAAEGVLAISPGMLADTAFVAVQ